MTRQGVHQFTSPPGDNHVKCRRRGKTAEPTILVQDDVCNVSSSNCGPQWTAGQFCKELGPMHMARIKRGTNRPGPHYGNHAGGMGRHHRFMGRMGLDGATGGTISFNHDVVCFPRKGQGVISRESQAFAVFDATGKCHHRGRAVVQRFHHHGQGAQPELRALLWRRRPDSGRCSANDGFTAGMPRSSQSVHEGCLATGPDEPDIRVFQEPVQERTTS